MPAPRDCRSDRRPIGGSSTNGGFITGSVSFLPGGRNEYKVDRHVHRQRRSSRLEELPEELIVCILAALPDAASLASLGATCKPLRALVVHHTTGARALFTDASFAACMRSLPRLQRLEVRMLSPLWDASPLANQKHLTRLVCANCAAFQLPKSLSHIPPSVVELDLRGSSLAVRAIQSLPLGRLRSLDLRHVAVASAADMSEDLTPHLAACTSLQVLGLSCKHSDSTALWATLAALPALRELALTHASFPAGLQPASCPAQLRALSLAHSHVADLGCLLPAAAQLTSLRLDTVLSPAEAWEASLPALQELFLAGPVITAAGLRTPPLRRLWLHPASGCLQLRDLPAATALASLSSLALVGVRACKPAAAASLARLRLHSLALVCCSARLQARLLAPGTFPELQSLAVAHAAGEQPPRLRPLPQPRLTLLLGSSQELLAGLQAQPSDWRPCDDASAHAADLAEFPGHIGRWAACVRKGAAPGMPFAAGPLSLALVAQPFQLVSL